MEAGVSSNKIVTLLQAMLCLKNFPLPLSKFFYYLSLTLIDRKKT